MEYKLASIQIENTPEALQRDIIENLYFLQGRTANLATLNDWYMAVSYTVRDRLMKNWTDAMTYLTSNYTKMVGYLSAEYLPGPHLASSMMNLGIEDAVQEALDRLLLDYRALINQEEEPGLGNGGLGRLAACFLDSMSSLKVSSIAYGIRYEFGIFDQRIENGEQVEVTDKWLRFGNPWEIQQAEISFKVKFGGHTETYTDDEGRYRVKWIPAQEVRGVAYDTPIPGYKNDTANLMRLWKSEACESFDFNEFNKGNYDLAVAQKTWAETISKVLYPNDAWETGKKLRLMQQYFFVSCTLQDNFRILRVRGMTVQDLPEAWALQLNDTHPSIAIAEMMRLLVDEKMLDWDEAWQLTCKTFAYTNHTLLPEALERWPLTMFAALLPRHLEIIYEINDRFLSSVRQEHPGDETLASRLSLIDESGGKFVRMANLAAVGSHAINGVSKLHTELLKKDVLADFYSVAPEKFVNITNGVTPRRWVRLYNPALSELISTRIGEDWITNLETELKKLEAFTNDPLFQKKWREIKINNKKSLADRILKLTGTRANPESLFDVQVKRIHEYKRQHLNLLHIVTLYNRIRKNPQAEIVPRTFIFGGKAAPNYHLAKLIIKLINAVAEVVNNDPLVADRIKVVFYPDYNVKNSEWVYRAANLSEQISAAGKEASGTGNMKFSLNGAVTIGTLDGANVEMREAVGAENFFLFGLTADEVYRSKAEGYEPMMYYESNDELKAAIDLIQSGYFSGGDTQIFSPLTDSLLHNDSFMVMADYASYIACQQRVSEVFKDQTSWMKMSILNVARLGYFSSDRSIREYCKLVWDYPLDGSGKLDEPIN